MTLLIAAMVAATILGMLFRKHDRALQVIVLVLSVGVTTAYFVFANRFIR